MVLAALGLHSSTLHIQFADSELSTINAFVLNSMKITIRQSDTEALEHGCSVYFTASAYLTKISN